MAANREPRSFHVLLGFTCFINLACLLEGKGGSSPIGNVDDPTANEPTYPSQIRNTYYVYYIAYFTPSGHYYATTAQDSQRTVNICENYEPYYGNDTFLGVFPCPMENDPDSFKYCCGESRLQYCCKLIDKPGFKLMVGLVSVAVLGLIIGIIVCLCLTLNSKKKALERRRNHEQQMKQMGIPKYDEMSTGKFKAEQSDDGYQVVVKFKSDTFYTKFWHQLQNRYPEVTWRSSDNSRIREGKITFSDGSWVSLMIAERVEGKNQMVVLRERAAVNWMNTDFVHICNSIPDNQGICSCWNRNRKKTHPEPNPASSRQKYEQTEDVDKDKEEQEEGANDLPKF